MWAEAHARNAVGRLPDTAGALSFDDYMVGEQQQLLGHSMAEKEVYLGVQVQTRSISPCGKRFPSRAEGLERNQCPG